MVLESELAPQRKVNQKRKIKMTNHHSTLLDLLLITLQAEVPFSYLKLLLMMATLDK
jgi:hypothetical protein